MAVNKVVYGASTLVDLTGDTVTPDDVAEGVTFHGADGVKRSGTRSSAPVAHASTHATGGSDPITPASIGAAAASHTHTPASIGAQAVPTLRKYDVPSPTITLSSNTEYRFSNPLSWLTLNFPAPLDPGAAIPEYRFECWLRFTMEGTAARAGDVEVGVEFPKDATFLGNVPTFEPNKTYEMSIKNGCVVCAEVVSA